MKSILLMVAALCAGCAATTESNPAPTSAPASQPTAVNTTQPADTAAPAQVVEAARPVTTATSPVVASGLTFQPQPGWIVEAPAIKARVGQYRLPGPGGDASLIIYYFGADGAGSAEANIERWVGHITQPDGGSSREVATIESRAVNGMPVHTVDVSGTYVAPRAPGVEDRHNLPDHRLCAAVVETEAGYYYVNCHGPASTVGAWRESFDTLLASMAPAPVLEVETVEHR